MTLTEITQIANDFADEQVTVAVTKGFANECIANINAQLSAKLPMFDAVDTDYTALSEVWLRSVVIPYVSYAIKLNDGSLNEADTTFIQRYNIGMSVLKKNKKAAIAEEYRDSGFSKVIVIGTFGPTWY